jgi:hypothetical protein
MRLVIAPAAVAAGARKHMKRLVAIRGFQSERRKYSPPPSPRCSASRTRCFGRGATALRGILSTAKKSIAEMIQGRITAKGAVTRQSTIPSVMKQSGA